MMPTGVYERSPEYREQIRQQRLGAKASAETRAKMSASLKGRQISDETREKIRASLTGRKRDPATVEKMRAAATGRVASEETREKMRAAATGMFVADGHPTWKGDEVGYWGVHSWLRRHHPKTGVCEHCGKVARGRAHDYASIGHTYVRDRAEWLELCRKCHKAFDRNMRSPHIAPGQAPHPATVAV